MCICERNHDQKEQLSLKSVKENAFKFSSTYLNYIKMLFKYFSHLFSLFIFMCLLLSGQLNESCKNAEEK